MDYTLLFFIPGVVLLSCFLLIFLVKLVRHIRDGAGESGRKDVYHDARRKIDYGNKPLWKIACALIIVAGLVISIDSIFAILYTSGNGHPDSIDSLMMSLLLYLALLIGLELVLIGILTFKVDPNFRISLRRHGPG